MRPPLSQSFVGQGGGGVNRGAIDAPGATGHARPMCTLYKMRASVDEIAGMFGRLANPGTNLPSFDEIYPKYEAPVLRHGEQGGASASGELTLETMRWGMPPAGNIKRPVVNVRNLQSNFWKNMLANPARRCLVPVTQFCEWAGEKGSKYKVWFAVEGAPVFAFAGIWRPVPAEPGEAGHGARMAFLTCAPNETVGAVHPQAMPVILPPESYATWLTGEYAEACALAVPLPDSAMAEPVEERR